MLAALLSILGIHSLHVKVDNDKSNLLLNNDTFNCLNIFSGSLEEANKLAAESNGLLLLFFHDSRSADSVDFIKKVITEDSFLNFAKEISFKQLITMIFDVSKFDNFQLALSLGIQFCPAVVVKVNLQTKFQTVLSHEGFLIGSQLCSVLQSVLLSAESEYAQAEELKAVRSLQSEQDEAYRRSVEADLKKRKIASLASSSEECVTEPLNRDVNLQKRIQDAKAATMSISASDKFYRIQFVLPDGSRKVYSFGSDTTSRDLFNCLFSSESLISTNVLIRSIEPVFEIKDSDPNVPLSDSQKFADPWIVAMLKWWKNWTPASLIERVRQILVLGEYRGGVLVGMDKYGNKYYEIVEESKMLPFRNRYVEYAAGRRRDASQIPAEWHGWLHSTNDEPPTKVEYKHSIADVGHTENLSGTSARYIPYNTAKPKIQNYQPNQQNLSASRIVLAERLKLMLEKNKER